MNSVRLPGRDRICGICRRLFSVSGYSLVEAEKKIHEHLTAIGHTRAKNTGGGKEWFLTNFESVVSTASLLRLELEFDVSVEDNDEEITQ